MIAHEKGRARSAQRPIQIFPYPSAGCPTGVPINPDGDAVKVSRYEPKFKAAVSIDPQEHGDAHQDHHGCG
jgi:streptogramin lyase